jgi:4-hydroxy-3-methylbut-2-en-1-yl diphosphate synthase IspG/GcpE
MKINEDKLARVSDLLEKIQETEEIIRLHNEHGGLSSQISQYYNIRENLVNELAELMHDFHFKIKYQKEAA